jgi:hypothetical protein
LIAKLLHYIFPYLNFDRVTQVYVWRLALKLQLRFANTQRKGTLGHYYEFGVFRLRSIINFNFVRNIYSLRYKIFKNINIYAFDSFKGLPESSAGDVKDPAWVRGNYLGRLYDVKLIAKRKNIKNIQYIEGFFNESLTDELANKMKSTPPSLLHIDCDLYSSAITVLKWLDKITLPGAIYFFDDIWRYHGHPDAGELKAIKEYNNDLSTRGMLIEHSLSLGSKMVYIFCPRNSQESVRILL